MAKKIVVNENEDVKVISKVTKLVTRLSNGENCTWVPEDEIRLISKSIIKDGDYIASNDVGSPYGYSQVTVNGIGNKILGQLGEKNITKNGTYIAENDSDGPYYGYSRVVVNVEGGDSGGGSPVVGKDDDGDDAVPKIDEDGHIVTEKLPTRISINVYPDNLVYEDGQAIDFTGLRVKAFLPNDTEWGIVDDNELIKPVTVSEYSGDSGDSGETGTASKDGLNFLVLRCNVYSGNNYAQGYHHMPAIGSYIDGGQTYYSFLRTDVQANVFYTKYSFENGTTRLYGTTDVNNSGANAYGSYDPSGDTGIGRGPAYVNNNEAYIVGGGYNIYETLERKLSNIFDSIPFSTEYPQGKDISGIEVENQTQQTIPLQWKRPGDGKVLETSFTIAVHGSSGGDNNTSGGNVTPGGPNIDVPQ